MTSKHRTLTLINALVLAAGLGSGAAVLAAQPWIGVPSATAAQTLVVAGGSLGAWQAVVVKVRLPSGEMSTQLATANAAGVLAAQITTSATGNYSVEVFDAAGQRLGGGNFVVSR